MSMPWKIIAGSVVFVLIFLGGFLTGRDYEANQQALRVAEAQRRAIEKTNEANRTEAERLALEQERDRLAEELEDAARQDPDANRPALGIGSVRRLQQR